MPAITFGVFGDPVPQPRPRVSTQGGFARAYVPASHPVHAYRQHIAAAAKDAGVSVSDKAVEVWISVRVPRPKSHRNKNGLKASAPLLPREDVDNVAKAVLDALTCVAWHDDRQVADLHIKKRYGDIGYTEVTIETLSSEQLAGLCGEPRS